MAWRQLVRNLWHAKRRRSACVPRIVEFLEARVLLTDVAYYDLLKGQCAFARRIHQ
jgi:hypothetical protein